ncbi:BrnT family toxin [Castellaniella sp.]|uniref:BrnT family toxin n=1 Tax=Castellaniella sp. TaxID=1955812 RepID=UPI003A905348
MGYNQPVEFEWDEAKSEACFQGRGFDFAYAAKAFFDPYCLIRQDNRRSYGEDRYQLIGKIDQRVFVVVYTTRVGAVRIISARKANQREVQYYDNCPYDP